MKIVDDDYTFSITDWGIQKEYGTGAECNNNGGDGKIRMDLRGTDFHFHQTVSTVKNNYFLTSIVWLGTL